MEYYEREYDVYVLLPAVDAPEIWQWDVWQRVVDIVDPLIKVARDRAAIRTIQYEDMKPVSFGRLIWKSPSMQKWTHHSPATESLSSRWRFLSLEVWAPSWTTCERDHRPPDVYMSAYNDKFFPGPGTVLQFSQRIVLAVARDISVAASTTRSAALELSAVLKSVLTVFRQRPWGKPMYGGFTDAIQDLDLGGLFKVGDVHQRPLDLLTFSEDWEIVPSEFRDIRAEEK